jgi:hypothetical protein
LCNPVQLPLAAADANHLAQLIPSLHIFTSRALPRIPTTDQWRVHVCPSIATLRSTFHDWYRPQASDTVWFTVSSHGYTGGAGAGGTARNESDGSNEYLVWNGTERLLDDELRDLIVTPCPVSATLLGCIDSCSSGTMLDLPYQWHYDVQAQTTRRSGTIEYTPSKSNCRTIIWSACTDRQSSSDDLSQLGFGGSLMSAMLDQPVVLACLQQGSSSDSKNLVDCWADVSVVASIGNRLSMLRQTFTIQTTTPTLSSGTTSTSSSFTFSSPSFSTSSLTSSFPFSSPSFSISSSTSSSTSLSSSTFVPPAGLSAPALEPSAVSLPQPQMPAWAIVVGIVVILVLAVTVVWWHSRKRLQDDKSHMTEETCVSGHDTTCKA